MGTEPSTPPGLYVHAPFCRSRCHYCDFYSTTDESRVDGWIDGLLTEATRHRGRWETFDTLYIGGGTPSRIPLEGLQRLLDGLRSTLEVAAGSEVTLEVNPDDVDADRARAWRGMGINRVSVGVQSFDDGILELLGRRHGALRSLSAIERLADAGFDDLGVDLIFAVPGMDVDAWKEALYQVASMSSVRHVSCYELTVEEGTTLARRLAAGKLPARNRVLDTEMFLAADRVLGRRFEHYEISNYALAGGRSWRSRHNDKYWRHVPYLGLGPAAHSLRGRQRRWNPRSLDRWATALTRGHDPTEEREQLSTEQWYLEELMLGLRTSDGVTLDIVDAVDPQGERRALTVKLGLIEISEGRARPTRNGMLMADGLPLMLTESA